VPGGKIDIIVAPDLREFPRELDRGLKSQIPLVGSLSRGLGLAVAAGTGLAVAGLAAVVKVGNEYSGNLNSLRAVTHATSLEMVEVGRTATALGSDLTLPATSAADAAAAMLELSKGGLSVQESMSAAKGTLQLAAAAQIGAAQAAEIQAAALNQFGLAGDKAGHVADVLANTANAAAGEITDMGLALKYVGPIAASLKIGIEDTAAAVGLLASNGILGENAGTALRGILAGLAAPSKEAASALKTLGVQVFDSGGNFVGLRKFIEQLTAAQGRMTDAAFTSAAATAFGREPLAAITALAAAGADDFDAMATAVNRVGGAADVASAQTQGLGGAMEGLKSQLETTALGVYDVIAPALESLTRGAAESISDLGPVVSRGLEQAAAVASGFGPLIADKLRERGSVLKEAATEVLGPLGPGAADLLNTGVNVALDAFGDLTDGLDAVVDAAKPVAKGIASIADAATDADGPVSLVGNALDLAGDAAAGALRILQPVGAVVGGLAESFAELPGPGQAAVVALGAYRLLQGRLSDLGPVAAMRQFGDEVRVQQGLAANSGVVISRLAATQAAFETSTLRSVSAVRSFRDDLQRSTAAAAAVGEPVGRISASLSVLADRVPLLGRMRDSFRDAAAGAESFGRAQGIAAAAGVGLRGAVGGIATALGGPVGIGIAAVTIGLGLLSSAQEKNKAQTRESTAAQHDFARSLRESNGAITESIRQQVVERAQKEQALSRARALGIAERDVTDAILGQGKAFETLRDQLAAVVAAEEFTVRSAGGNEIGKGLTARGKQYKELLDQLLALHGEFAGAQGEADEFNRALGQSGGSLLTATDNGRTLANAMGILADSTADADSRSRALKDALDALSGGQITYEQAVSRLNDQTSRLADSFISAAKEATNAGTSILDSTGGINSTTDAGRRLLDLTDDLGTSMADAAVKTFEFARANGDDSATALQKAADSAGVARDQFIKAAIAAGIGGEEALKLADRYNLVPSEVLTLIEQPGMSKAQIELLLLRQRIEEVPDNHPIVISTLSEEATRKLEEFGFKVRTLPDGRVEITATDAAARRTMDAFLASPATKVVQIVYRGLDAFRTPGGAIGLAGGGLIGATAYANGGMHRLRPMSAGRAAIVAPNTWRILGDRIRDDELYLPLNRALADSHRLLGVAASRMGYALVRLYAAGGIASAGRSVSTSTGTSGAFGAGLVVNQTVVAHDQSAAEVADRAVAGLEFAARLRPGG
jgi:TP901 family phage tail tape measure protein